MAVVVSTAGRPERECCAVGNEDDSTSGAPEEEEQLVGGDRVSAGRSETGRSHSQRKGGPRQRALTGQPLQEK